MKPFSSELQEVMQQVETICIEYGKNRIESTHLLLAIVQTDKCSAHQTLISKIDNIAKLESSLVENLKYPTPGFQMQAVSFGESASLILKRAEESSQGSEVTSNDLFEAIISQEDTVAYRHLRMAGYFGKEFMPPKPKEESGALKHFSTDLIEAAEQNQLDPVFDRETELERIVQILGRKRKNNPILIGEAGVGKTAIVEGLAQRIVSKQVPEPLRDKRIFMLDLNALISGAVFRGQFEQRLQSVIQDLRGNPDYIVFIDEIHGIVGSGNREGQGDTANILKPYLARGEIRCIGATTAREYKQHIETDAALERRFQKIYVEPPNEDQTLEILTNTVYSYEKFHDLQFTPKALEEVVYLGARYITDKNFPDKGFDVIDEAGSIAKLNKTAVVDEAVVQRVVATMTGIPVDKLSAKDREKLKTLEQDLNKLVVGQEEAIRELSKAVKRARVKTSQLRKAPSFLFLGPTGVGKTYLAKQLAKLMFNSEKHFLAFDMSEFSQEFTISNLIGAPPGYIGYEEGGKLTEAVRRRPYSVVLFDEIEKAHPKIYNVLLQILEEGHLTDSSGRQVDFQNTIIIMTGNIGARNLTKTTIGFGDHKETVKEMVDKDVENTFQPEFINRVDNIVFFNKLTMEHIGLIFDKLLVDLNPKIKINISEEARKYCVDKGWSDKYGARPLRRVIQDLIETKLADKLLETEEELNEVFIELIEGEIVIK